MSGVFRIANASFGTKFKINRTVNVIVLPSQLKIVVFDDSDVLKMDSIDSVIKKQIFKNIDSNSLMPLSSKVKEVVNDELYYTYCKDYIYDNFLMVCNGHIHNNDYSYLGGDYYKEIRPNRLVDSQMIFDSNVKFGKYLIVFQNYLYEIILFNTVSLNAFNTRQKRIDLASYILEDAETKGFHSEMVLDAIKSSY